MQFLYLRSQNSLHHSALRSKCYINLSFYFETLPLFFLQDYEYKYRRPLFLHSFYMMSQTLVLIYLLSTCAYYVRRFHSQNAGHNKSHFIYIAKWFSLIGYNQTISIFTAYVTTVSAQWPKFTTA